MKIIQKRLNNSNVKTKNTNNLIHKNLDNVKSNKNYSNNIIEDNKKNQKNKKVKLVGFSYNNKDKINNINSSQIHSPNKTKSLKKDKDNNNTLSSYNLINYKKSIIHRHTKSLYNQNTEIFSHLIKDMNNSENINLIMNNNGMKGVNKNANKKNIYNYANNDNKNYLITNCNKNINKLKKNKHKNELKNNLINHHQRESSEKEGLTKIIKDVKISDNKDYGLSRKFINAQNKWRKNYFATVIQKIYRGYSLRKSDYRKKKNSNKNSNSIYIKKRAKDNKYICMTAVHHRKCPTEENLNLICQQINKTNSNNIKEPPKIKEIVILRSSKKKIINEPFNFSNNYFNNFIYNCKESYCNQWNYHNNYLNKCQYIFEKWKEYSNKKKILYYLKTMKKYAKKNNRFKSYEKENQKKYNIYKTSFIKQFYI